MSRNETDTRVGESFQSFTKYNRESIKNQPMNLGDKIGAYKSYPDAAKVALPEPIKSGGKPYWDLVARRRTQRKFPDGKIGSDKLSQLLWASQGITGRVRDYELRSAPSAGALYPVETYVVINKVEGIEAGLYHYDVREHALELLEKGELGEKLMHAGLMQPVIGNSAVTLVWTAMIKRARWKYGQRAYRYVYLDAGHIAQNVSMAAEGLDMGSCLIGAFFDDEVNDVLKVDGQDETVIYMCATGPRE